MFCNKNVVIFCSKLEYSHFINNIPDFLPGLYIMHIIHIDVAKSDCKIMLA